MFVSSHKIKDILKGELRFNQSQLEAEENEELTIADDHYTLTAAAETALIEGPCHGDQDGDIGRRTRHSDVDGDINTEEEEQTMTPCDQQVMSWSVYVLIIVDTIINVGWRECGSKIHGE